MATKWKLLACAKRIDELKVELGALKAGKKAIEDNGGDAATLSDMASAIDRCTKELATAAEIAERLGLSEDTVEELLSLARTEGNILLNAVDDAVYAVSRYYINNQKLGLEIYIAGQTNKYVTVTGDTLTPGLDLLERG